MAARRGLLYWADGTLPCETERWWISTNNTKARGAGARALGVSPAEARRVLRRLEFHHTPKHASWFNMVEIEIGVLRTQCLNRRIQDPCTLESDVEPMQDSPTSTEMPYYGRCGSEGAHLDPLAACQRCIIMVERKEGHPNVRWENVAGSPASKQCRMMGAAKPGVESAD
jgi:DDE superfamily endonuclease